MPIFIPALTLSDARTVLSATMQAGLAQSIGLVVAVVDAGGHLMAFERSDNLLLGSIEAAQSKARTAVLYQMTTLALQEMAPHMPAPVFPSGVLPFAGGVPITVDGKVIGAVGVSGGTIEQDHACALAGISALGC